MSAFVVDNDHITYLVNAAITLARRNNWQPNWRDAEGAPRTINPGDTEAAERAGRVLLAENVRSVNARYSECEPVPEYSFDYISNQIDPIQVFVAVRFYRYQACETSDYEQSEAEAICRMIEREAQAALIEDAKKGGRLAKSWGAPPINKVRLLFFA